MVNRSVLGLGESEHNMVGSSKILTVSYGTFSCTLEGFDESFDTMKSIAEYFRDLAADDRYFGAEPPTPDAEMLTRIAEREISRRVEARTEASGIVLRPAAALAVARGEAADIKEQSAQQAQPAQTETAPQAAPVSAPVATEESVIAEEPTEDDVSPDVAETPVSELIAKTARVEITEESAPEVAEQPDTIENVADAIDFVDEDAPHAPAEPIIEDVAAADVTPAPDEDLVEEAHIEADAEWVKESPATDDTVEIADITAESVTADVIVEPELTAQSLIDDADAQTDLAETNENASPEMTDSEAGIAPGSDAWTEDTSSGMLAASDPVAPEQIDPPAHPDANSVAAKLQRIRAVVGGGSTSTTDANGEDDFIEDLGSDDEFLTLEDDENADDAPAPLILSETSEFDAGLDEEDHAEQQHQSSISSLLEQAYDEDVQEDVTSDATPEVQETEQTTDDSNSDDSDPQEQSIVARVVRMKRADFEKQMAEGALLEEETEDQSDWEGLAALDGADEFEDLLAEGDSALSDDDDPAFMQELADIDSDGELDEVTIPEVEDEVEAAQQADESATPMRRNRLTDKPDDGDLSRIMSETDAKMSEPEGNRRREAIAHLKAAVAATEAARQLGDTDTSGADAENAFREDLDQVVRPRRAPRAEKRTERPRPAPLKLVASQRVDTAEAVKLTETAADGSPVRPRRVRVSEQAQKNSPATGQSFADYAISVGATELQDMLEAAAAYTAIVEGADQFSRPQLLRKVRKALDTPHTREDELRSFGILLRQGRIEKVRNGRFQISEQTRFRPEPRAAQG